MATVERAGAEGAVAGPGGAGPEVWISRVLRGGVTLAGLLTLIGLVWFVVGLPQAGEPQSVAEVLTAEFHPSSPGAILAGVAAGRPTSLIRLGILVLVLTPAARVALTLVLFVRQGDRFFVAVTGVVLAILLLGLTGIGR